ncbi:MAG: hypothetical protein GX774_21055 [Armatimonadetes bacterium]|nr:hypothetical protein [Armatimonadota bacterium]
MIPLPRLRELAERYLGPGLREATPATVQAFLDRVQLETAHRPPPGEPWSIDEAATSYEEILRDFFWYTLHAPTEEAVPRLWVTALEACFGSLAAAAEASPDEPAAEEPA